MEDKDRLETLHDLALDQVRRPEVFGHITQLAAEMFDCEISLVSIVDSDRQWFLGKTGLKLDETTLESSICAIPVQENRAILINDAAQDPALRDNPLVAGQPCIRSYLGVPIREEDGTVLGALCVIARRPDAFDIAHVPRLQILAGLAEQSISAHAKAQKLSHANSNLSQFNRLFKQAEIAANIGAWRVDLASDELTWSDQVYAIHGLPRDTDIDVNNAINFYAKEDREQVSQALMDALDRNEAFTFEANIARPDGQTRRVRSVGERIDVDGTPDSIAGIFLDCTEEHLQHAALKRAAEHDQLTGLYNRMVFDSRLTAALRNAEELPVTMMLLDLDGFKEVNDTLGHLVGDRVLTAVAEKLQAEACEDTFLARWGGDEFAFLFPLGKDPETVRAFGERLVSGMAEHIKFGDETLTVGCTCGIAQLPAGGESAELVRRADLALYEGKAEGKGAAICWSDDMESRQSVRQVAIGNLKQALHHDRVFPVFQPIVDLESGDVVAAEALLRLRDEDGRTLSATEVLPALLDPILSRKVSSFMLENVFDQGAEVLSLYGDRCRIAVNVSEADLRKGDFVGQITRLTEKGAINPNNLIIEVTETMLLTDENGTICDCLGRLAAMGCDIALDDFGTGFSSLTHLRNFPISTVKIDREFVSSIKWDHQSRLIIQAIVQMGRSLGLEVVAEGVETQEQLTFLTSAGCTQAQGYLFAKPAPVDDLQPLAPSIADIQLSA
uniref:putative bifunctional diguanylate cyclase/phosphodiesterase n=1 Tax=uncultured Erythrobacter sp. TaxID=263913 RepID=UPI00260A6E75|nr:EAL domain-containing protein [uncultured Erythrobacter sp.]